RFAARHAVAFMSGLAIMLFALASPLEALAHRWLAAHMVQHLLLMVVVAPLLWMGAPVVPLLVSLPRWLRVWVLRAVRDPRVRRLTRWLLHPGGGGLAFGRRF